MCVPLGCKVTRVIYFIHVRHRSKRQKKYFDNFLTVQLLLCMEIIKRVAMKKSLYLVMPVIHTYMELEVKIKALLKWNLQSLTLRPRDTLTPNRFTNAELDKSFKCQVNNISAQSVLKFGTVLKYLLSILPFLGI